MAKRNEVQAELNQNVEEVAAAAASPTTEDTPTDARSTSFEVIATRQNRSLLQKDTARKKLAHVYNKQPKVSVMVAPMYAAYFGKVMHVMINGISIAVPCDGRPYNIPATFAEEVHRRLRAVNDAELKSKRFADVASNVEKAPGELALY
jgi:hypothetical protein